MFAVTGSFAAAGRCRFILFRTAAGGSIAVCVVRTVKSGSFENDPRTGPDLPFQGLFMTFGTSGQRIVRHFLKFAEFVSAILADVFIRRHCFLNLS